MDEFTKLRTSTRRRSGCPGRGQRRSLTGNLASGPPGTQLLCDDGLLTRLGQAPKELRPQIGQAANQVQAGFSSIRLWRNAPWRFKQASLAALARLLSAWM